VHSLSNGTTFNDLDSPGPGIRGRDIFATLNISEMTRHRAIVTIEHQSRKSHALYRMVTFPMTFSNAGFKVTVFF